MVVRCSIVDSINKTLVRGDSLAGRGGAGHLLLPRRHGVDTKEKLVDVVVDIMRWSEGRSKLHSRGQRMVNLACHSDLWLHRSLLQTSLMAFFNLHLGSPSMNSCGVASGSIHGGGDDGQQWSLYSSGSVERT
jgi:hypothetical protein